jgi:hypothetical protein
VVYHAPATKRCSYFCNTAYESGVMLIIFAKQHLNDVFSAQKPQAAAMVGCSSSVRCQLTKARAPPWRTCMSAY